VPLARSCNMAACHVRLGGSRLFGAPGGLKVPAALLAPEVMAGCAFSSKEVNFSNSQQVLLGTRKTASTNCEESLAKRQGGSNSRGPAVTAPPNGSW
jgi:hypothetical protein